MKAVNALPALALLVGLRSASAEDVNLKGAVASNTTAGFWGVEAEQIEK